MTQWHSTGYSWQGRVRATCLPLVKCGLPKACWDGVILSCFSLGAHDLGGGHAEHHRGHGDSSCSICQLHNDFSGEEMVLWACLGGTSILYAAGGWVEMYRHCQMGGADFRFSAWQKPSIRYEPGNGKGSAPPHRRLPAVSLSVLLF